MFFNLFPLTKTELPGRVILVLSIMLAVPGCAAVALTAGGLAGSVGVDHTLSGIAYKTFTAPIDNVETATLAGLKEMDIGVEETQKTDTGYSILAAASNRQIHVDLEQLTPKTTRMRVVAKKDGGFLRDSATATEIIIQTAQILDQ
ncbi:MAG: DUF3568 domain-containing protein [Gammaproteobacteria bacterium]|nr:DUF3568 domain-containing protein [Gammaproteobacteria bacterium]